jgi:branched-subunit amino acid transport protein AzlD
MTATTLLQLGFKNYLISLFGGIAVYVALVNQVF